MSLLLLLNQSNPAAAEAITPTISDIGALLRARTYVMGNEVGTFNEETRPTATQVKHYIDLALGDVLNYVGIDIPTAYWDRTRQLGAYRAAALVEAAYFPDQINTDRSAHRQYNAIFLEGVKMLAKTVRGAAGSGIGSLPVTTLVAQSSPALTELDLLP